MLSSLYQRPGNAFMCLIQFLFDSSSLVPHPKRMLHISVHTVGVRAENMDFVTLLGLWTARFAPIGISRYHCFRSMMLDGSISAKCELAVMMHFTLQLCICFSRFAGLRPSWDVYL
jgi:hypothetical protein